MSILDRIRAKLKKTEVRRALDPATGQPVPMSDALPSLPSKQWAEGKLTYIGLLLTAAGAIGKMVGVEVGSDEGQAFFNELLRQWDDLATLFGLLMAWYGRVRINWRKSTPNG